jgi:hypothetical protein
VPTCCNVLPREITPCAPGFLFTHRLVGFSAREPLACTLQLTSLETEGGTICSAPVQPDLVNSATAIDSTQSLSCRQLSALLNSKVSFKTRLFPD